jgi:hypothetical protein
VALDLSEGAVIEDPAWQTVRAGYHLPYSYLAGRPRRGLVLGAGMGNDVEVMLDEGVDRIDAVEIDPLIFEAGKRYHPNHPYDSPRVSLHNGDARTFLNNSNDAYDIIVFGTLDSMTRLSALSNVRLDNFVYTVDCLRAAASRLKPGGGIVMYFMVGAEFIDQRLGAMLVEAFDQVPLVVKTEFRLFNRVYMAGPGFDVHNGAGRRAKAAELEESVLPQMSLPTDDWPFLYLFKRGISSFYLSILATIALLSVLSIAAVSPEMRRDLMRVREADWVLFLFGLAFLLLESSSVTRMNLVWGATWLTSAVVFASILFTVLLSTITAELVGVSFGVSFAGLFVSLLGAYLVPGGYLLVDSVPLKALASLAIVGAPIFFAGLCFAQTFKEREHANQAFGWNLLGAVAGGLLEFAGMWTGLGGLILIASIAYALSFLTLMRAGPAEAGRAGNPAARRDPGTSPVASAPRA